MAMNPMQRKIRNSFLFGFLVAVIVAAVVIGVAVGFAINSICLRRRC